MATFSLARFQVPVNVDRQTQLAFKQINEWASILEKNLSTTGTARNTSSTTTTTTVVGSTFTASGSVIKGQVVYAPASGLASVATNDLLNAASVPIGIATSSASNGQTLTVAGPGQIASGFSGLTVGPVYLGMNGTITQTPPTAPLVTRFLGTAINNTDILVQLQGPQQVYNNDTPAINYPAIAFTQVRGFPGLYQLEVNV